MPLWEKCGPQDALSQVWSPGLPLTTYCPRKDSERNYHKNCEENRNIPSLNCDLWEALLVGRALVGVQELIFQKGSHHIVHAEYLFSFWKSEIVIHYRDKLPIWWASSMKPLHWVSDDLLWLAMFYMLLGELNVSCVIPMGEDSGSWKLGSPRLRLIGLFLPVVFIILSHIINQYP